MAAPQSPSARRALLLLVVVAGALTAGAIYQRDLALEHAFGEARGRAELYTETVLRSALVAGDLAGPLSDVREDAVLGEIEPLILRDPAVARVRLWTPPGTLLFSTDAADVPGATSADPIIGSAAAGRTESRDVVEAVSRPTDGGAAPTPLLQTFVPLRLRGSTEVGAVAEIEQFAAVLESRADAPWWGIQVGAGAITAVLAILAFVLVARGARPAVSRAPSDGLRRDGRAGRSLVQEQGATAEREVERANERARLAEARADDAEEQVRAAAELAAAAEQRIDQLQIKLQEVASSTMSNGETVELQALREELAAAMARAEDLERRLAEVSTAPSSTEASLSDEVLGGLERRVAAAEDRATQAEERLRVFEDGSAEEDSSFRHTLTVRAAGRKLAAPPPPEPEVVQEEPEVEIRRAISRGLRGPLTRAAGLTLSLQGAVESAEGKSVVRQLSNSLRRLDQLAADLHDVRQIVDGTLQLNRRRTDLSTLLTTTLEEADVLHEDRLVRLDAEHVQADVDPARMRQIVEGMLEASKDRTRIGAAIVVRARTTDRGVMVSVEDDNKTPATVGPELRLAARLAELHGSELLAEGSAFKVFLRPVEG